MMINRIKTTHYEKLAPKKGLKKEEFDRLINVLQVLIRTHIFFEYGEEIEPEDIKNNHILIEKRFDFEGVVYKDEDGILLYDLEDYQIHSVYFTEDGSIMITAYLKRAYPGVPFYAYPENLRYFKVSDDDCGFTTEILYYCFITDVDIPVIEI